MKDFLILNETKVFSSVQCYGLKYIFVQFFDHQYFLKESPNIYIYIFFKVQLIELLYFWQSYFNSGLSVHFSTRNTLFAEIAQWFFLNIVHKGRIIGAQKGQNNVSGLSEKIKSLLLSCESTCGPLTFGCNRLSGKILVLKLRPKIFSANSGAFANLYYFGVARYLIFFIF